MSPLGARLARRIAASGPIGLADYMAACLFDPDHGYYATRDPLGVAGDFTTAPEISQMFGELIGLALAQAWRDRGRPAPFALVELGPGRGTLMADMLRAAAAVPGFADAAEIHLVEASRPLRETQAERLAGQAPTWHDTVDGLPHLPTFAVANEFLDALPIRQFVRADGPRWHERQVGLDAAGALTLGLAPPSPYAALDDRLDDTAPGEIVETCPALPGIVAALAGRIAGSGGAALVIDYGGWHSRGDTLQALRGHAPVGILDGPGTADLTGHVDFEPVAATARAAGAAVSALTPQGVFLERLGITARAQALARGLSGAGLASHVAAHRRLTHPDEMGSLFQVIGVADTDAPLPPGLTA